MKKQLFLILSLCAMIMVQSSCSKDDNTTSNNTNNTTSSDTVVVINGVKWATRNLATPGTFAASPEASGMFYQWNSKVGWPATGAIGSITATDGSTTWNSSWTGGYTTPSSTDTWTSANDPSPAGWRVPTLTEIQSLLDTTKVTSSWITYNGVNGRKFMDKTSGKSIFLPAVGLRGHNSGNLSGLNLDGDYWASTAIICCDADGLFFNDIKACLLGIDGYRPFGYSIRPVAN